LNRFRRPLAAERCSGAVGEVCGPVVLGALADDGRQEVPFWEYWERFGWFHFASSARKYLFENIESAFQLLHFASPEV
jgi:hypothetical protein